MGVKRGHPISWLLWLWVVLHGSGYQRQIIRRTFCNLNCWVIPLSLLLHFIYSMCVSVYVGQGIAHIWRSEDNLWKTVFSFHQMGSRDWFRSEGWQKHLNTWIYLSGLHVCFLNSHRVWKRPSVRNKANHTAGETLHQQLPWWIWQKPASITTQWNSTST